jgi:hypothetical protein
MALFPSVVFVFTIVIFTMIAGIHPFYNIQLLNRNSSFPPPAGETKRLA